MSRTIFSTVLILLAVAAFFTFVDPTYKEIKILSEENSQFDEALNRSKELQAVRDGLLSRYNTFSTESIDRIDKLLPDNVDNVRLILDLDSIASKHGMLIKNVSISDNDSSNENTNIITQDSPIGEIDLSFKVTSPYADFKRFISDLEQSLRIVDIKRLSFRPRSESAELFDFDVSIRTYWLK